MSGFKLKDIFNRLGSKANTERPSYKAPSGGGDIKKEMDWKYGHGEFADIKKRRKPGESKFNYDVRMRKEGYKATSELTAREKFQERVKKEGPVEVDFSLTGQDFLDQSVQTNPNDLRAPVTTNFDITDEMSFDEAFQQAKLKGREPGASFEWRGDPYKWELKEENKFGDPFYRGKTNMITNF